MSVFRVICFWSLMVPCFAATGVTLSGVVIDPDAGALPRAEVVLVETQQKMVTDAEGRFQFENVTPGVVHLQAVASGFQPSGLRPVALSVGQSASLNIDLAPVATTRVTMTVTGSARETGEVRQAVDVLTGAELDRVKGASLGETLATRPGVTDTAFGPTAGRPIIRGMSGGRIRVLEGGMGTGDVSTTSVDHVVTVDLGAVNKVEILRGPATLRYGGSAAGGVVNLLDTRIPEVTGDAKIQGTLALDGDTVADRRGGHLRLKGEKGRFAWQVQSSAARTGNYTMPGAAERFPEIGEEENPSDALADSDMDLRKVGIGFTYATERAHLGVAVTDYRNNYGVPGHEHDHHDHDHGFRKNDDDHHDNHDEELGGVVIDLDQKRLDLKGGLTLGAGLIHKVRFEAAATDYEHTEGESGLIGTRFTNEYTEGRVEAETHGLLFFDQGNFGVHGTSRDFSALGAEAFVQPNRIDGLGLYLFQEKRFTGALFHVGARYDRRNYDGRRSADVHDHDHDDHDHDEDGDDDHDDHGKDEDDHDDHGEPEEISRHFNNINASIGFVLGPEAPYSLAVNLSHTERSPTPEALFAQGPHIATTTFELGDPELKKETGHGLDVAFRKRSGRVTGEIALFYNDFENFIYEQFTGEEIGGLREALFVQANSKNYGGEAWVEVDLRPAGKPGFMWRLFADQVRAALDDGTPMPRITPRRYGTSLLWRNRHLSFHGEVRRTDDQDRLAPFETDTMGYTMVNLGVMGRFQLGGLDHQLHFRLRNVTDEEARIHTSFLKDRVLQPGRNLALSYRLNF